MRKCIVAKLKLLEDLFFENGFVVQRTVLVFKSSGIRALVELPRSLPSAGREFGDLVLACPGPEKVLVANAGPS